MLLLLAQLTVNPALDSVEDGIARAIIHHLGFPGLLLTVGVFAFARGWSTARDKFSRGKSSSVDELFNTIRRKGSIIRFPYVRIRSIRPVTVVLADDETGLHICKDVLEQEIRGAQVHLATSGKEAWNKVQFLQPDLVITDIYMPDVDGFDLIARIRDYYPAVPVLAVSNYIADACEIVERIGKLPQTFKFLTKPFGLTSLVAAVEDLLLSRRDGTAFASVAI